MKILHVVQGYTPAAGGTEQLIQKLSEQLVRRHNDEVTVFTTNAAKNCSVFWLQSEPLLPPGIEKINGVTVRRFPVFNRLGHVRHQLTKFVDWAKLPFNDRFRALFNGPIIFGMTQQIARFDADIICASSFPFLHMHYALAGGRRSGKPVILCGALHPTDSWGFERPMIYQAINQAAAYIAHSNFEREYLIKRGIPAEKITAIGAGIDLDMFTGADGQGIRAAYGWGNDPVIAFVGQLNKRKGLPHLLTAMPHVWNRFPSARLLLAGSSGTYVEQLKKEIARLSPPGTRQIVLKIDFPEEDKAKIFAACDIFVLPSAEESFGIVFLEAWACHKPVIGIRAGAVPSIIADDGDGLLASPGRPEALATALCQLLANPAQRRELGQAGYKKVGQHYTWDKVTDKYREVYLNILNRQIPILGQES